jgi:hypothetical protein
VAGAACAALAFGLVLVEIFFRLMYFSRRWRFSALLYCLLIKALYFVNPLRLFGDIMIFRWCPFNIYLGMALILAFSGGCRSTPEKKALSVLRLHLEVNRDATNRSSQVPIYREKPVQVNVEKGPFISEGLVKEARVIDTVGGFAIRVQFERRGTWLLEQYTGSNRGKRIAVYGEFFDPPGSKTNVTRWLAAPVITRLISDGVFTFTPDATRDESVLLVLGLNNIAKKNDEELKW